MSPCARLTAFAPSSPKTRDGSGRVNRTPRSRPSPTPERARAIFFLFFVIFGLAQLAGAEHRKLLPIPEAARRLGIGRTKLYELIAAGDIATVRIGNKRRLIPVEALDAYADSLPRETTTAK